MIQSGKALQILLLEDDESDAGLIEHELKKTRLPFQLHRSRDEASFRAGLERKDLDLILSDMRLTGFDGLKALKLTRQIAPSVPFVIVTGTTNEETVIECMKNGAADYVLKQHWVRLGSAVQSILKEREGRELRELSERALRESEARNRAVLETALDCIVVIDDRGLIVEFNPAAERTFGYLRREVLGQPMADLLIPPSQREHHRTAFTRHLETGQSAILGKRVEMNAIRSDGAEFPMELAITRVEIDGAPLFTAYLRDISERKQAEQRLKASLQEKEVLLKEIHHRVKNNLQIISSLFNLETGYAKDAEIIAILREHRDRVQSMALVHEQLYASTDFARVEFCDYLRRLTANLVRSFGSSGVQPRFELEKTILSVDSAIACGLLVNELISNSLKHAFREGKGEILLSLHKNGSGQLTLIVHDDGVGLPPGQDWRKSKSLGLQLVGILADQLKASVAVDSSKGTRFEISFAEARK